MKNYDQLLDEVAQEYFYKDFEALMNCLPIYLKAQKDLLIITREAAERYRAQVELPSDEEIFKIKDVLYIQNILSQSGIYEAHGWERGAKFMRDHIKNQLNDKK